MVPLLVLYAKLRQHTANGTVLAVILPIAIAGTAVYYFGGREPQVDLRLALLLIAGSVFGAFVGARAMNRLSAGTLRAALAVILVIVGVKEILLP